jgi:hypothetical protein
MSKLAILAALAIASVAAFLSPATVQADSQGSSNSTTVTGTVSCSKCQGIQPLHKGYTRWTWALQSISEGDDMVLVVGSDMYKLQGDKDQILKFMESKATVTGTLEGQRLTVQTIVPPAKNK